MTQIAAIAKALLEGQVLSIMTGFKKFYCTNLPRELSRGIEKKFQVVVSKERVEFTSQYGQKGFYFRYRLNSTDYNAEGIKKMQEYVHQETGETFTTTPKPITVKEHTRSKASNQLPPNQNKLFDL